MSEPGFASDSFVFGFEEPMAAEPAFARVGITVLDGLTMPAGLAAPELELAFAGGR